MVMLRSVLASVPIYFLSLFQAPKLVMNQLERVMRDFLWGSNREKIKIHWVGWKDICKLVSQGSLGIRSLGVTNRGLFNKWVWRFGVEKNASWQMIVDTKYEESYLGWTNGIPKGARGCGVWANICKGEEGIFRFVRFKINNGERVRFWHDPWCERGFGQSFSVLLQSGKM